MEEPCILDRPVRDHWCGLRASQYGLHAFLRGHSYAATTFPSGISVPHRMDDTLCTHGNRGRQGQHDCTFSRTLQRTEPLRYTACPELPLESHIFLPEGIRSRVLLAPWASGRCYLDEHRISQIRPDRIVATRALYPLALLRLIFDSWNLATIQIKKHAG